MTAFPVEVGCSFVVIAMVWLSLPYLMSSIATVTQKRFPEILLLLVNVQYPYQWDRQVQTSTR
jgi:hypothetical protein